MSPRRRRPLCAKCKNDVVRERIHMVGSYNVQARPCHPTSEQLRRVRHGATNFCARGQLLARVKGTRPLRGGCTVTLLSSTAQNLALAFAAAALVSACGGQPKQVGDDYGFEQPPPKATSDSSDSSSNSGSSTTEEPTKWTGAAEPMKLNEDQEKQISIALTRGEKKAANCSQVVDNAPTGEGEVKVTFDGKIGKATDAEVLDPFKGTAVETCIKRSFIGEYCLPFEGEPLVRRHKIKLPPKK